MNKILINCEISISFLNTYNGYFIDSDSRRELQMSREGSSNTSEGGSRERPDTQRESSLEDSGVVDDHEDVDMTSVDVIQSSSSVQVSI